MKITKTTALAVTMNICTDKTQKVDWMGASFIFLRDPKHSPGGELVLGGTDPNYYTGNFNYMDTRETGKWEVTMKG